MKWSDLKRTFSSWPVSRRYAVLSSVLFLALIGAYEFFPGDSAKLHIVCQHSFRSAQLTVSVNGKVVCETALSGGTRKHFGILPKGLLSGGSFSTVVNAPAGKDLVKVHLSAPAEGFDETRALTVPLITDTENLLAINSGRGTLIVRAPGGVAANVTSASQSKPFPMSFFSILFSALGTMFSASVSFMVQEFWRSYKSRVSAQE